MFGPLPTGLVGRLADGHFAQFDQLKDALFESSGLIGVVEAFQYRVDVRLLAVLQRRFPCCEGVTQRLPG